MKRRYPFVHAPNFHAAARRGHHTIVVSFDVDGRFCAETTHESKNSVLMELNACYQLGRVVHVYDVAARRRDDALELLALHGPAAPKASASELRRALADLVEAIGGDMDDILAAVDRARKVLAS